MKMKKILQNVINNKMSLISNGLANQDRKTSR